ncbi:MAG: hypothetical protein IKS18_10350 [Lachnospiraceae bacterium]|nr:hypothetical protein [Lachnospiraceae bacterium]
MRSENYKGRCTKIHLKKCRDIARLYDKIQLAYAYVLDADDDIKEIRCNVPIEGVEEGNYVSDFVCTKESGEIIVRECVWRKKLNLPRTAKLLDASRIYWKRRGVEDWAIVVEEGGAE